MLTHLSFAHMPSPIPRCPSAVLLSLAFRRDGGLRSFRTSSAFTLPFSRLARRSLLLWPARSLVAFSATFCTEGFVRSSCPLRTLRLLPAGATVAGWDNPPPTGVTRPFHGARETEASGNTVHLTILFAFGSPARVSWLVPEICESDIRTFFALRPSGRSGLFAAGGVFEGFHCAGPLSTAADPQGERGGVAASLRRIILREWVKDNRSGSMF